MPTYEYVCADGHAFEQIQKMSEPALDACPACGAAAVRKVSGGQGLIFKGSGFYITDYGKDGKGPRKAEAGDAAAAPAAAAPKADAPAASPAPAPAPAPKPSSDAKGAA